MYNIYSNISSLSTSTPLSLLFPATTIFIPSLLKLFSSSAHFLTLLNVSGIVESYTKTAPFASL